MLPFQLFIEMSLNLSILKFLLIFSVGCSLSSLVLFASFGFYTNLLCRFVYSHHPCLALCVTVFILCRIRFPLFLKFCKNHLYRIGHSSRMVQVPFFSSSFIFIFKVQIFGILFLFHEYLVNGER